MKEQFVNAGPIQSPSVLDRSVNLGGVFNVRDLGGIATTDGHIVRSGMLFRASSLHRLTDQHAWNAFGPATVFDLRYQSELDAFPLPNFIDDVTHAPVLLDGWRGSRPIAYPEDPEEHLAFVYWIMLDKGADIMRGIVEKLCEPDSYPAIFFCMAGKDRTGFVAAVLLALLGVDDETIADDFALSGSEVVAMVAWLKSREDFENHPMMNQPKELMRAPRGAMMLFLAKVNEQFGSLSEWAASLGVSSSSIDFLRSRLLISPENVKR